MTDYPLSPTACDLWREMSELSDFDLPICYRPDKPGLWELLKRDYAAVVRFGSDGTWLVRLVVRGKTIDELCQEQEAQQ